MQGIRGSDSPRLCCRGGVRHSQGGHRKEDAEDVDGGHARHIFALDWRDRFATGHSNKKGTNHTINTHLPRVDSTVALPKRPFWSLSARNCRWLYCEHTDESDGAAMFFPHLHFEEKPEKKFALSESVLSPNHHAVPLQRQNHANMLSREVEI